MTEPAMLDHGQRFARHLSAERRSHGTLRLYNQSIEFYSQWLEAQGFTATLDNLTRRRITDWLADLNEINQPTTVKTRYRGLHRFCTWLIAEDELDVHPMLGITPPVPKNKPVPIISDDDLDALIRSCAGK